MAYLNTPSDWIPHVGIIGIVVAFSVLVRSCALAPPGTFHGSTEMAKACAMACGAPNALFKDGLCGCVTWKSPSPVPLERP